MQDSCKIPAPSLQDSGDSCKIFALSGKTGLSGKELDPSNYANIITLSSHIVSIVRIKTQGSAD